MLRARQPEVSLKIPDGSIGEGEECLVYTIGGVIIKAKWSSTNPFYVAYSPLPDVTPEIKALARERQKTLYGEKYDPTLQSRYPH